MEERSLLIKKYIFPAIVVLLGLILLNTALFSGTGSINQSGTFLMGAIVVLIMGVVTVLYIYNNQAPKYAKSLKKSNRGEYEITDLNNLYLLNNKLNVKKLEGDFSWLDTGTFDSLLEASNYVKELENKK